MVGDGQYTTGLPLRVQAEGYRSEDRGEKERSGHVGQALVVLHARNALVQPCGLGTMRNKVIRLFNYRYTAHVRLAILEEFIGEAVGRAVYEADVLEPLALEEGVA